MKTSKYLFLFALILFSCSGDDDNSQESHDSKLIGTWNLSALEVTNGSAIVTVNGSSTNGSFNALGKDYDATLTFTESPNQVNYEGTYAVTLNYSVLGQTVTQEVPGEALSGDASWEVVGDTLVTTETGVSTKFFIKELTNTSLKLERVYNEQQEINGQNVTFQGELYAAFTK